MIIENITSKGISLDRNGQSMQREVYEREIVKLQSNWNSLREWLEEDLKIIYRDCGHRNNIMRTVLDKMNELEKRYEKQDN